MATHEEIVLGSITIFYMLKKNQQIPTNVILLLRKCEALI